MSKPPRDFPGQAFLELLRPPRLMRTRLALFATYSADPLVLGGALLNLHARGRDSGGGNKSDFASAVEELRGRVRFVAQRGRILRGRKLPRIAAILDQFVVEEHYDESESSWHPKIALLCFEDERGRIAWRLWIGSRNLTMSSDLDLGLVLDGEPRRYKGGRSVPGIDDLGATLAEKAGLPGFHADTIRKELSEVRWAAPEGIEVSSIELWSSGPRPTPPLGPTDKGRIIVLSPFLCDRFSATLADLTKNSTDRTLVTTLPAVRGLSAPARRHLAGFKVLSLTAPSPEGGTIADMPSSAMDDAPVDEADDGPPGGSHAGFHAKLFATISGETVHIVAGSANATDRAWSGRNAEAVARFKGGRKIIEGLTAIVGSAYPIPAAMLDTLVPGDAEIAERQLERLRRQVSGMPYAIRREGTRFTLSSASVMPAKTAKALEVGLATQHLHQWPSEANLLDLGDVPLALQTDFVAFRLKLADLPAATWLQRVPVTPAIDPDRDAAAISRFLSVAGLQSWLRDMLDGEGGPGKEDDWDDDDDGGSKRRESWKHDGFALEDILSAWAKDSDRKFEKLKRVDRMLDRYVATILAHGSHLSTKDRQDLTALQETWSVARDVLMTRS